LEKSGMTNTTVRYLPGGDNRLLRHFLRAEWDSQCYWCGEVKDFVTLEIDHIVPKASDGHRRTAYQAAFKLSGDYDVNALENLAPICGRCNKAKSSMDLTGYGLVITALKQARRKARTIERRVRTFRAQSTLGEALLVLIEADLDDAGNRSTFEEGVPAVVKRLSELGLKHVDFHVVRPVGVELDDETHPVTLRLNEQGRSGVDVLERIAGGVLEEVLRPVLSDLFTRTSQAAAVAFEEEAGEWGAPDVGTPMLEWPHVIIDSVSYTSLAGANLEFEIRGELDAMATGWLTRSNFNGDGLEQVQADATISSRFWFTLAWSPEDPQGDLFFDQVWLDAFEADTWLQVDLPSA